MAARRDFLRGLAVALPTSLAGCSALANGPPEYADWLYAPGRLAPAERHAFASLDLAALRKRDTPDSLDEAVAALDDEVPAVRFDRSDRLLAQVAGDLSQGRAVASAVAVGSFTRERIRRKLDVDRTGGYQHVGNHDGFELYTFSPAFLADLDRYRPPDGSAPDLTLAVGASEDTVVAGAALAPDRTGLTAVRATLAAQADDTERLIDVRGPARDLLAVVGEQPLTGGIPGPVLDALRPRTDGTLREVLTATDALGVGVRPAEETADLALVGAEDAIDPSTVRRAVSEAGDDGVDVQRVTLRRGGRVVLARTTIDIDTAAERVESLPGLLRGPVLNAPRDDADDSDEK